MAVNLHIIVRHQEVVQKPLQAFLPFVDVSRLSCYLGQILAYITLQVVQATFVELILDLLKLHQVF
jgi:hypothetical protein